MSYRVNATHPEALRDGRSIAPGERISDADANKNEHLISRGVLVKEEAERRKPSAQKESGGQKSAKSPAAGQEKEE
jgi:hypothetical protein